MWSKVCCMSRLYTICTAHSCKNMANRLIDNWHQFSALKFHSFTVWSRQTRFGKKECEKNPNRKLHKEISFFFVSDFCMTQAENRLWPQYEHRSYEKWPSHLMEIESQALFVIGFEIGAATIMSASPKFTWYF